MTHRSFCSPDAPAQCDNVICSNRPIGAHCNNVTGHDTRSVGDSDGVDDPVDVAWLDKQIANKNILIGTPITYIPTTDSTNTDARCAASNGACHGALFLADAQRKGRGSRQRQWVSPASQNLYFSLLLRPNVQMHQLPAITLCVGVAIAQALEPFVTPEAVGIKWPNDILIANRKVAGILVEGGICDKQCDYVVVGVGINVHQKVFDASIAKTATSIACHRTTPVRRQQLLLSALEHLQHRLAQFYRHGLDDMLQELQRRDVTKTRCVLLGGLHSEQRGVAKGIAADGRLMVDIHGEQHLVTSGEVQVLKD